MVTDNSPVFGKTYTYTYPEFGTPASRNQQVRYVVYSGNSCFSEVIKNITLLATPTLQFNAINGMCSDVPAFQIDESQILQNGLPGTGVFSGTGVSATGMFDPNGAGAGSHLLTYTYTGTNGCINTATRLIDVYPTPAVNAGPDKVVLEGGSVTLTPAVNIGVPTTYTWTPPTGLSNPNILNPVSSPVADITYKLTVTTDMGCNDDDEVIVKVLKTPVIPNIFSPNGDGIHDKWEIEFLETYPGCVVQIYNRYGQMVHRIVNYTTPWDGKISGRDAPIGTYYYIIDPKNGRKPMTGFVDIIR
jgi:gliding motility-associated-like protein